MMSRCPKARCTLRSPGSSSRDSGYLSDDPPEDHGWNIENETPPRSRRLLDRTNYHLSVDGSAAGDRGSEDDKSTQLSPSAIPRPKLGSVSPNYLSSPSVTPSKRPRVCTSSSPRSVGSLRSPDRFVSRRDPATPSSEKIRVTKDLDSFSPTERLLRHQSATSDPFQRPQQRVVALASNFRSISYSTYPIPTVLSVVSQNQNQRPDDHGTIWTVGGPAPPPGTAVDDGRGHYIESGTNARLFTTNFATSRIKRREDFERNQGIVADALQINQVERLLDFEHPIPSLSRTLTQKSQQAQLESRTRWTGTKWHNLPTTSYKVLDAPGLRDDYYCSVLAYSPTCGSLAVGLGSALYGWTEQFGAVPIDFFHHKGWVTSLSFSSVGGGKAILAIGRAGGQVTLISLFESLPLTMRPSKNPNNSGGLVPTEDLLVGNEQGQICYYVVEWPHTWEVGRNSWGGTATLVATIAVHTQQICGLVWAPSGREFVSGSNDNMACYFEIEKMLKTRTRSSSTSSTETVCRGRRSKVRSRSSEIAGDSGNHFESTPLATIAVSAQVTSLIWSTTRPEIVATFGYAAPEHPYRIAVFSWPSCEQIGAVALDHGARVLHAIPYPGAPADAKKGSRSVKEGTIVMATSDENVKFHDVWKDTRKAPMGGVGVLSGSDILEGLAGIFKEGGVIR
ncbi:WD domain-containing protein [Colletotrichum camelliae]|nr:WD domain-containing protein [Colletotrichum camelliae]